MHIIKKIGFGVLITLIVIQFIQPSRNENVQVLSTDITNVIVVPNNVLALLKKGCYNCHSNNTTYLWYDNIQPVRWFIENHIKNGKAALNFSEFGLYSKRKQANKLKAVGNQLQEGTMPISSYTILHRNDRLNSVQKHILIVWAEQNKDRLMVHDK